MPYRNAKGNWRMKASFGWMEGYRVGVVDISLRTDDKNEAVAREAAVRNLKALGRADLLIALKEGRYTAEDIHRLTKQQRVLRAGNAIETARPLREAMEAWLPDASKKNGLPLAEESRRSYRKTMVQLLKCARRRATVADLPSVFWTYRERKQEDDRRRVIGKAKALCLAFLRGTMPDGAQNSLYQRISRMAGAPAKRKHDRNAQMVWRMLEILDKMPAPQRNVAWFMLLTGCHGKEYRSGWDVSEDRVIIHGTKNENRADRVVPKLSDDFQRESLSHDYRELNRALKEASSGDITHYDLRATYEMWLTEAGVPQYRVNWYMGHSTASVADGYKTTRRKDEYLVRDTALIVDYIRANRKKPSAREQKRIRRLTLPVSRAN